MSKLSQLLDDERLQGAYGIERLLGPRRVAALVDSDSVDDAVDVVDELCLLWGGSAGALIPHAVSEDALSERWRRYLVEGVFDDLGHRTLADEDWLKKELKRHGVFVHEYVGGELLLAVLHGLDRPPDAWAPVDCSLPDRADPWFVAYVGCLGSWPERPPQGYLRSCNFVPDFEFDRLLPVERGCVSDPGAVDLLRRMRRGDRDYPARIARDSSACSPLQRRVTSVATSYCPGVAGSALSMARTWLWSMSQEACPISARCGTFGPPMASTPAFP